jgi:hypothetical protein
MQAPEDVKHLLFQCDTTRDLWSTLGLSATIDEASQTDHSGSVILEILLREQDKVMPGYASLGLKEVIGVTCWYIWWIRRRRTHNESVPPLFRCKMSVLAISANVTHAKGRASTSEARWGRRWSDN